MAAEDVRNARSSLTVSRCWASWTTTSLEEQLQQASVAVVTQHYEGAEFNIPSKLMNFMAYGLPILAAVNPAGEVARIVEQAGAGWVVDSRSRTRFPAQGQGDPRRPAEIDRAASAARRYAQDHFTIEGFAARFEGVLREVVALRAQG